MSREDQKEALQYRRLHFLSQSGGDGDTTLTSRKFICAGGGPSQGVIESSSAMQNCLLAPVCTGALSALASRDSIAFSLSLSHPPFLGGARGGVNCRIDL